MAEHHPTLSEDSIDRDPFRQFAGWFDEAVAAGLAQPEAAAVATAAGDGSPSVRMVLVKQRSAPGFVFFTNYDSRKGRELAANPRAAMLFHWEALGRQVRLEGRVERLDQDESEAYIRGRPRGSQLSALASHQSRPIESRRQLEERVHELAHRYADQELPVPSFWGGFRLLPESFEFWQHRPDRLHDRLLYTRGQNGGWRVERLAP